jgi:integrase
MNEFVSTFASKLDASLDFREARGYKRDSHLYILKKFDRYCAEYFPSASELTSDIVHGWFDAETNKTNGINATATAIRQFGKYLNAIGENAYVLPDKYSSSCQACVPYNFTDDELTALFRSIDALPSEDNEPFINEVAPVLFRLIYTCGLRPNEGRELLSENINLKTGEVLITRTKRHRERIVVMSDDMLKLARKYDLRRSIFGGESPYFFPSSSGEVFGSNKILMLFNRVWTDAVCTAQNPVPKRIRVYDLRNTHINKIRTFLTEIIFYTYQSRKGSDNKLTLSVF